MFPRSIDGYLPRHRHESEPPAMTGLAVCTRGLTRRFAARTAVDRIDLEVPEGSIYGFLGPNGSGKTTTIRMLLGLLRPDAGEIVISGLDALHDRRRAAATIGAMLDANSFYPNLSGRLNLLLTARLLGASHSEVERTLAIVDMEQHADRKLREYSLGMRQRLGIARALLGRPSLVILDEPMNGLDPDGIIAMRHFLQWLPAETGATIFLSSHLLSEVELISTHLGILSNGRLVTQGRLSELQGNLPAELEIATDAPGRAAEVISSHGLEPVGKEGGLWRLPPGSDAGHAASIARVNHALVQDGIGVHCLSRRHGSLESFYRDQTRPLGTEGKHGTI